MPRELADLAGQLDARGPGADDREGQPGGPLLGVVLPFRHLEGTEDSSTQRQRLLERLHPGRPAREAVVAEVGRPHPTGEDQAVVADGPLAGVRAAHDQSPGRRVDRGHLAHLDRHVALPAQDVARDRRDLAGGENAGCHLVEERREKVVVGPLEQRDVGLSLLQRLRGEEAAEAGADDHDAVAAPLRRRLRLRA
jgi:hypothetical protein